MGEIHVLAVIFGRPSLVSTGFAVIPVVVVLMALVVVPFLVFVVSIPLFVVLMVIVLKIGACQHPRRCNQSRAEQK
jgi:hypothetical protein